MPGFAEVEIDDRALREALTGLLEKFGDLKPAYRDIGEKWLLNTRARYDQLSTGASVDGVKWAPLSQATKDRKQSNKDKILIESGTMRNDHMVYQIDGDSLVLGNSDKRAAAHQFGMKQGYAGRSKKRGLPIPWGDIPARPFVMVSADDEQDILGIIVDHLNGSLNR